MFDPNKEIHEIALRWKAIIYEENEDEQRRITYQREKPESENLRDFICAEKEKGAKILADFFIDGIELGLWLNLNYFRRNVVGSDFENNLSIAITKLDFSYNRLIFKRLFGEKLTLEDCAEYYAANPKYPSDGGEWLLETENEEVLLYVAACCGDKLCGAFGAQIEQTETEIVWELPAFGKTIARIAFEKSAYIAAFDEYKQLIFN